MKAGISEKKDKSKIQDYPSFKGKLELIFKIMNVLIGLSLSEGQISDEKIKNDFLKKYDDLFKKMDKEMLMSTKSSIQNDLFNAIISDITLFNPKFVKEVFSVLQTFKQFIAGGINIDSFLEQLITSLKSTITQIKKNNGKNQSNSSFKVINEFYLYLDEFSEKIKNLKQVVSKKKYQEEEIKLKEKEDIYNKLSFEIESLKKQLEEKGNELKDAYQKSIQLSLNNSSYKESNEILIKKLGDSKITIKQKDKDIQEYRDKIDKMEKLLYSIDQKHSKAISEYAAEFQKLKNATSTEIQNLKNINSKQTMEIQNLKKTQSENVTEIQSLKKTQSESATEIQNLKERNSTLATENQNLKKINNQYSLKIQKLENDNFQMKNKNLLLEQRIGILENQIIHLLNSNEEIKQNSKKEIARITKEQMENIRICMNNFRELKNYVQYLEENDLVLYDQNKKLANRINLFIAEYGLDYLDDDDENYFNYNLDFK